MSEHTKEPWKAELHKTIHPNTKMYWLNENTSIGTENAADARRIVACVNVCAGLREDELAHGVVPANNFILMREQRDELLAEIKAARDSLLESEGASWAYDIAQINAAIAKAEATP